MTWATGKSVLVTGGSQGIGLATARAFAALGATVHITGTGPAPTDYADILDGLSYHGIDLTIAGLRPALVEAVGPIDVLVNNAGMDRDNEYTRSGFEAVINLNLNAVMDLCRRFHGCLSARGGAIVNVGSLASFVALRDSLAYTASKAGLLGLTRALADKWAMDAMRVNLVAPGLIETRMIDKGRADAGFEKRLLKSIPMQRWGKPDDIAQAIVFLASPAAAYITGQSLAIDGGMLLR
jgi:3-oxoacyl-[acyl-carrier protein] reductase